MDEKWYIYSKKADFEKIAEKFNISKILARIIRNRDVIGDEEIEAYLNPKKNNISSPWLMKDMEKAVELLQIKIGQENKIRIICDYDVDGVCSGYVLLKALRNLGAVVDIVVPSRVNDGYGLNQNMVKKAYDDKVDTLITCDNGIAAYDEISLAKSYGMSVIVTDHHEVPYENLNGNIVYTVPKADAVIDPKQEDCTYPFKSLCGCAIAYQFLVAVYDAFEIDKKELDCMLPYVALATVCDVVDLSGENRSLVVRGTDILKKTKDVGLCALIKACKLDKMVVDEYHYGFVIGPCINAAGRIGTAKTSLDLFMENDEKKAEDMAKKLVNWNDERKAMTDEGEIKADIFAAKDKNRVLVIFLEDSNESVAGIVAGRIREKYNKPTIVITKSGREAKGSGRSIEGYDMYKELCKVKDLFTKFGGHEMAAGMSLPIENIELLRKRLNDNCVLLDEDMTLKVWIDMQLPFEYVNYNLIDELKLISPYGKSNPKPLFAEKNLKLARIYILGKTGNVLRLELENERNYRMTGMIFRKSKEFMEFIQNKYGRDQMDRVMEGKDNDIKLMAVYYPRVNDYHGNKSIQIVIEHFC